jgi:uncharacterized protein (TIGR02598 family)
MKRAGGVPRGGFSLVEVVIALGIVTFAIVALIGLFGVGLQASKQASEDTETSAMACQILNQYRNGTVGSGTNTSFLFDSQGVLTTVTSNAFYVCTFSTTVAGTTVPDSYLIKATAQITWPYTVSDSKRPFTNLIYATFPPK